MWARNDEREESTVSTAQETDVRYDEEYVQAATGERIFARRWLPAGQRPTAVAVIAHGLGEHSGFYLPVTRYLLGRGLAVYAYDQRGFGRSEGRRGHVMRYEQYIEDLRAMVARARAEQPELPMVLLGHSMGGTIAVLFAERYPRTVTHVILSAPALILRRRVSPRERVLAITMSRLKPTYTRTGKSDPTLLTRDPAMQQEVLADRWRHQHITARLFMELFVRAPREALAHLHRLRMPLLIIHGADDPLVSPASSQRIYRGAASSSKRLRIYRGLRHETLRELERAQIFADVGDWLGEQGLLRGAAHAVP
jgi:alpha-beta hydrolase superfamily lysophospholipase